MRRRTQQRQARAATQPASHGTRTTSQRRSGKSCPCSTPGCFPQDDGRAVHHREGDGDADATAKPPMFDRTAMKLPGSQKVAWSVVRKCVSDLLWAALTPLTPNCFFDRIYTKLLPLGHWRS
ncbi:hypothetical protein E2562_009549 [Oryza meyeriana var. granulata]|uniref:Uncharacterized protein n=1 Tax=Oryza meyeriana var. granulata TaxID=110450 RepID=A0A6G1F601_9ORYZ|nr:hypothetical protein E2562_009549 [Oryza meyeriana var. granulata]